MFDIQKTKRMMKICGMTDSGEVVTVPNLYCVRKHLDESHKEFSKYKSISSSSNVFSFVSSPKMYRQQSSVLSKIDLWCHPYNNREDYLPKKDCSYVMMPESDFMDEYFVKTSKTNKKYDFFYLTQNAKSGIKHKGLLEFVRSLNVLCGKKRLKGIVVVYFPSVGSLKRFVCMSKEDMKTISKFSDYLTFVWGWQSQEKMSDIMCSCRFGFFPNTVDCSPRTIPECLLRNVPILVNKNILGGWHYVNENTGCFFNPKSLDSTSEAVESVLHNNFYPKDFFQCNYGFKKSSEKLSSIIREKYGLERIYKNMYFEPYKEIVKETCRD